MVAAQRRHRRTLRPSALPTRSSDPTPFTRRRICTRPRSNSTARDCLIYLHHNHHGKTPLRTLDSSPARSRHSPSRNKTYYRDSSVHQACRQHVHLHPLSPRKGGKRVVSFTWRVRRRGGCCATSHAAAPGTPPTPRGTAGTTTRPTPWRNGGAPTAPEPHTADHQGGEGSPDGIGPSRARLTKACRMYLPLLGDFLCEHLSPLFIFFGWWLYLAGDAPSVALEGPS